MKRESEKEWYFGNADKERRGPFSFEEVCDLKRSKTGISLILHSKFENSVKYLLRTTYQNVIK